MKINCYYLNCTCIEQQKAIDIYEFERYFKTISSPEIPMEYRPNNGFTKFICNDDFGEKWEMLSNVNKITIDEVKDFLKNGS